MLHGAGCCRVLRLAYRPPLDAGALLRFLAARAISGVEEVTDHSYRRTIRDGAVLELEPAADHVVLRLPVEDAAALDDAPQRARRLLDLDAEPSAVADVLARDPLLAPLVAARPGLRLPGAYDGFELAVRALLGQQVSVAAARTLAGRLVRGVGQPLTRPDGTLTHLFPTPAAVAEADLGDLGVPHGRAEALRRVAAAVAGGDLILDGSADPQAVTVALTALPGIGPWTVAYIALRALRDPDALPATDLGLRRALERAGLVATPAAVRDRAETWRPWRGYALMHLWTGLAESREVAP